MILFFISLGTCSHRLPIFVNAVVFFGLISIFYRTGSHFSMKFISPSVFALFYFTWWSRFKLYSVILSLSNAH